ncbi:sugar transferase [Rhodopirellula maiorica SM1]|uniref:Sugar transferase n=1 Tax=Rhodopirellula maiorica SM1 TaxID=1265738 RepID=M5R8T5_9BACT|nr:sugar transferase [Rhodopirellula maiorica SM1]
MLTIVRGRQTHLENQLRGLLRSEIYPDQWIVVGMDQEVQIAVDKIMMEHSRTEQKVRDRVAVAGRDSIDTCPFEIRTSRVDGDGRQLPLAEARNRAASLCQTEGMIFLDVDCIAAPQMIGTFRTTLKEQPRLWMGDVRYLPAAATEGGWQMPSLFKHAVDHPLQPILQPAQRIDSDRYELFWSLCFAITRDDFFTIGGFDDSFDGYGGEDTDFAFSACQAEVPFGFVGATAFHQYHAVCKPPLNHFEAIVRNAIRFQNKWGVWPMESWLNAFADRGLIRFNPDANKLVILRNPTAEEIRSSETQTPAGF